jgi:CheY-like chemotaxis protein
MQHKALIVDDQPDIRKLIMLTMESEDFELHEADNGVDGLHMARNLRPAVMLLDVMMPGGLDGYQVCEEIKLDPDLRNTMVILLTARGQRTDTRAGDAGLDRPGGCAVRDEERGQTGHGGLGRVRAGSG